MLVQFKKKITFAEKNYDTSNKNSSIFIFN